MGELFRAMNAECLQQTLDERLWGLFLELLQEICEALEKDIDEMLIDHELSQDGRIGFKNACSSAPGSSLTKMELLIY